LLIASQQTLRNMKLPERTETKVKKVKKPKTLDTPTGPSLESFFTDDGVEHIPKDKIAKIDGDIK
jgi:uncharacterized protein (DUF4213/DUF364 family)